MYWTEYSFQGIVRCMGRAPGDAASKSLRLAEFLRRLGRAPAAQSYDEARQQIAAILNAVEDEMSGIPYDPSAWRSDGRMYPPQDDREVRSEHPAVRRFRSVGHATEIGSKGAIRIRDVNSKQASVLDKAGLDGRLISDL